MADLPSALRAFRTEEAKRLSQPAYCVFSNAELDALVAACPRSTSELGRVKGFGKAKVAKFGDSIVRICSSGLSRPPPSLAPPPSLPAAAAASSSVKRKLPAAFASNAAPALAAPSVRAPPPLPPVAPIAKSALNAEQATASERVLSGENTFLTGAAGTGKSFVLRYLIQELEKRYPGGVAVTAPTGIAASHVQGVTIHSWAGIGLGKGNTQTLIAKVQGSVAACERWRKGRVLIIDEISMLDSQLFDKLDAIGRAIRGDPRPFGGLQLIMCGDFYQLPPVSLGQYGAGFAFQAAAWLAATVRAVVLRVVVRQQGDQAFIDLLGPVRVGVCSAETSAALGACHVSRKPAPADGIAPTKLYCRNRDVDAENLSHLHSLPGEAVELRAVDSLRGEPAADARTRLLEAVEKKAVAALPLKMGAQVLLTKNMPEMRLVNGSRGIVLGFRETFCDGYGVPPSTYTCPLVRFDSGVELLVTPTSVFQGGQGGAIVRVQCPLKLAWALTVHKSQGMSLSRAELMLEDAFDYGQAYVALSRVTSLAGLYIRGNTITQRVVMAHPAVLAFYNAIA